MITITNRTNIELYKSKGGVKGKHFTEVPIKIIVITVVLKSPGVHKNVHVYTARSLLPPGGNEHMHYICSPVHVPKLSWLPCLSLQVYKAYATAVAGQP